ncbi:hypothetical protein BCR41DRAFT_385931, partial [Lobosporangium transversale]
MTTPLTLFCVKEGESLYNAFSIELPSNLTVNALRDELKKKKAPEFDNVAANTLALWQVSIPIFQDADDTPIVLDNVPSKKRLLPTSTLSEAFGKEASGETIRVLVQPPKKVCSSIGRFNIVLESFNNKKFVSTIDTDKATMERLKEKIRGNFPDLLFGSEIITIKYKDCDGQLLEVENPTDQLLQQALKVIYNSAQDILVEISYPDKPFSDYTLKDVNSFFGFTDASDPSLTEIQPLEGIPINTGGTAEHDHAIKRLQDEIESRKKCSLLDSDEGMLKIVEPMLVHAVTLFADDLKLSSGEEIRGRLGRGKVWYGIKSKNDEAFCSLCVTKVQNKDFKAAVAENMMQLESQTTGRK